MIDPLTLAEEGELNLSKMHKVPREQRNLVRGKELVELLSPMSQLEDIMDGVHGGYLCYLGG